jgi:hypothetical protein
VVGDGGVKEYAVTPDGKVYESPAEDTVVDMPAHTKVYKDRDALDAAMVGQAIRVLDLTDPNAIHSTGYKQLSTDIRNMQRGVVKAIQNIPQPNIIVENPIASWVREGNYSYQSLNRPFKSR